MRRPGVWLAAFAFAAIPLVLPSQALAVNPPVATCGGSGGASSCSGWFRSNVTVSWTIDPGWQSVSCDGAPVTTDGVARRDCTVTYPGDVTVSKIVYISRDATPPQVTAATPDRSPDGNGWYNRAVSVSLTGNDATSGLAGCTNPTYAGPDSAGATVTGACRDVAGNTTLAQVSLRYDATPPEATLRPDRAPDRNGWYVRPLTVTATGSDATSGIASCSAPLTYKGPDTAKASFAGSCRDVAGNARDAQPLAVQYDATPPKLTTVRPVATPGRAVVRWRSAGAALVQIDRSPGINGAARTNVYRGRGTVFMDRTVKDGVRYRYLITSVDQAGNATSRTVVALVRGAPLREPPAGAVVGKPPRLAWRPVGRARFYNVQLFRKGVKILTLWPTSASLQLGSKWRYGGKLVRLVNGRYTWYVWPAFGTRAQPRYGRVLGASTFVVRRR